MADYFRRSLLCICANSSLNISTENGIPVALQLETRPNPVAFHGEQQQAFPLCLFLRFAFKHTPRINSREQHCGFARNSSEASPWHWR